MFFFLSSAFQTHQSEVLKAPLSHKCLQMGLIVLFIVLITSAGSTRRLLGQWRPLSGVLTFPGSGQSSGLSLCGSAKLRESFVGVSQVIIPVWLGTFLHPHSIARAAGLCLAQDNCFPWTTLEQALSCCVKFSRGTDESHCDLWMKQHVNIFNPSGYSMHYFLYVCAGKCVCVCV